MEEINAVRAARCHCARVSPWDGPRAGIPHLIAYEMGISPGTVRVLLHRAALKLRAKTRGELIAAFRSAGGRISHSSSSSCCRSGDGNVIGAEENGDDPRLGTIHDERRQPRLIQMAPTRAVKGGALVGSLDVAKRPRSWPWQNAMAFLSPAGLRVVRDMKRSRLRHPQGPIHQAPCRVVRRGRARRGAERRGRTSGSGPARGRGPIVLLLRGRQRGPSSALSERPGRGFSNRDA